MLLLAVPSSRATDETDSSTTRFVLATGSGPPRALALSSASLYAKDDQWKSYLADERVCPGGERTDLPPARQVATLICLVNYARQKRGLEALSVIPMLNAASTRKADAIVRCDNFAHNPCGGDWTTAVRSTGYRGSFGENLYIAGGPYGAPRVAVDAWLNSPPHRRNLFSARWHVQGVALLAGRQFDGYQRMALWVSVLGTDAPAS